MSTVTKNAVYSKRAVRDPDGKVLKVANWGMANSTARLADEFFSIRLVPESAPDGEGVFFALHDDYIQPALTIPQRAVIEAFAWYCGQYTQGLCRDRDGVYPKAILPLCDAEARRDVMPFLDEARAYQFAEVCQDCFYLEADVIQGPGGWMVVVTDDDGGRIDAETLARLQGACQVLGEYVVVEANKVLANDLENKQIPAPDARSAWRERQNAPLTRIESALGEILSRLGQNAATGAETPSTATSAKGRGIEALIPPAPTPAGKKSSARRSA